MDNVARDLQKKIIKKYRRDLWSKFIKAIKQFSLIEDGDKVLVAMSGGKDSFLLAMMLKELTRHPLVDFQVVFAVMDPGFSKKDLGHIKETAQRLDLEVHIEPFRVFEVVEAMAENYPCFLCARMRRGILYTIAEKYGCTKLALGHHYDDVIETTLLNLFYTGSFKTMLPKTKSKNYEGLSLIRPMYFVREDAIKKVMQIEALKTMDCGCKVAAGRVASKRAETKQLIQTLKSIHPDIDKSIFRAASNVNLNYVLGWEKNGVKHRFDDE